VHGGVPGLEFDIPPIVIEGDGLALTISSNVVFVGPLSTDAVSVSPDGSVNAQVGGVSTTFSSSGAIDGVEEGVGHTGVSVGTDGVSYTHTQTQSLGPDKVTAATKATIGPSKKVPSDAFDVTSGEKAGAALAVAGVAIGGGVLWWIAKAASPLCAPAGGPVGVAFCATVL
jgi:hypothetical protein